MRNPQLKFSTQIDNLEKLRKILNYSAVQKDAPA